MKGSPVNEMCLDPKRLVIMLDEDEEDPSPLADTVSLVAAGVTDVSTLKLRVQPVVWDLGHVKPEFSLSSKVAPVARPDQRYLPRKHRRPQDERSLFRHGGTAALKESFASAETAQLSKWAESEIGHIKL